MITHKPRFKPDDLKNSPKLYASLRALFNEHDCELCWLVQDPLVDIALDIMKVERRKSNGINEHG